MGCVSVRIPEGANRPVHLSWRADFYPLPAGFFSQFVFSRKRKTYGSDCPCVHRTNSISNGWCGFAKISTSCVPRSAPRAVLSSVLFVLDKNVCILSTTTYKGTKCRRKTKSEPYIVFHLTNENHLFSPSPSSNHADAASGAPNSCLHGLISRIKSHRII
jgi:hypothetical protein